ncbi:MAG: transcriptional repressor [Alphaproteobacteria bacterium]|nr:transcriptional repressor [Alphaproteobacteria bacterium]
MTSRIQNECLARGMKMTKQRHVIARVLSSAEDHPSVDELHRRVAAVGPRVSLATVYRTLRLLEEANIIERHDFRDGRSRYEMASEDHHDHLIDVKSGTVIEFKSEEIEALQRTVAAKLGYRLVDHRLELYAVPINGAKDRDDA